MSAPLPYADSLQQAPSLPPGALFAPAAARNASPLLEQLTRLLASLPRPAHVLELASGSGQHASAFCSALPASLLAAWQPTDREEAGVQSCEAYRRCHAPGSPAHSRHLPALLLDVEAPWPAGLQAGTLDVVLAINLLCVL